MQDEPLTLSLKIAMDHDCQTRIYMDNLLHVVHDDIAEGVICSYKGKKHYSSAFRRFRVSAHSLAVEVEKWNRRGRGRLPLEERLCPSGEIQTEGHVAQHCIFTNI
ncbi:hypothetical protein E2C01_030851 [Portunus trituberculatus]|uniref:Uncharacterized protein n=1 Tax=Portunus trituberculatus TaxID=210409 RepID=A0A5B7EW07_PORTR|nr:hypothetical protein [Portunus trituberculatus]